MVCAAQGHCSGCLVMGGQRLYLTVGQDCWPGAWQQQDCRVGSAAAQSLCSGFLLSRDATLESAVKRGREFSSLPEWGHEAGSLLGDLNQAELPTELPGQRRAAGWAPRLWGGLRSARIRALVAVSHPPSTCLSAPQWLSPSDPWEARPNWASRELPHRVGELQVQPGLCLSHWRSRGPRSAISPARNDAVPSQPQGRWTRSEGSRFSYLPVWSSRSLWSRGVLQPLSLPPASHSRIFTVVSYLCIVASWSSCGGAEVRATGVAMSLSG